VSVRHKPVMYRNGKWTELIFGVEAPSAYPTLCYKGIWVSATVLPSGTSSEMLDLEKLLLGRSTVATVVNLVRLMNTSSIHLCVHDVHDAVHCVGPSVAAKTCHYCAEFEVKLVN